MILEHKEKARLEILNRAQKEKLARERRAEFSAKKREARKNKKKEKFTDMLRRKWQERQDRKDYMKEIRHVRKEYHKRNTTHFKGKYEYAVKIAKDSALMLEQHFAGKASVIAGASCLAKMKRAKGDEEQLKLLYKNCHEKLLDFKRGIKSGQISFVDLFDGKTKKELNNYLTQIFPESEELVLYLQQSYDSSMDCSLRGGAFSGGWLLGGSFGTHHLRCKSKLGRRMMYGLGSITLGFGLGGTATFHGGQYTKDKDNMYRETTYSVSYNEIREKKLGLQAKGTVGLGLGIGSREIQDRKVEEIGLGLGGFAGLGFCSMFKIRDITPDFRELFLLLNMDFLE